MTDIKELLYGRTRCYLINNILLIDTDWVGTLHRFFRCVKENDVELHDIKYLFITHFHPDHMGIAQELAEIGIQIVVLEEQKNYLHCSDNIFAKDKDVSFKSIDEGNVQILSCADSRKFLESIGIYGKVVYTPVHSDDSISILLDDGIAIVGDLPPLHLALAYHDLSLEKTWNELLSHKLRTVYYGHDKEEHLKNINSLNDVVKNQ